MKILIKGGVLVTPEKSFISDILIEDEKIVQIEKDIELEVDEIIDATNNLIFPGFIDCHTHFDMDTGTVVTADNFYTGTRAAVIGGTTTIIDFATQGKGETLKQALDNWHKKANGQCSCDYGFHLAITDWNEDVSKELDNMSNEGVTSFKLYMAYDTLRVNDAEIYEVLKRVNDIGGIVGVHCENGDLVNELIKEQKTKGNLTTKAHPVSRPDDIEAEAIARFLRIALLAGVPVNIVHLSTKKGFEEVERARIKGQKIYVETCPQYLLLEDSKYELEDFEGAKYVISPPLRKSIDKKCLWDALKRGEINTIGTDHCSFNFKKQKELGINDFSKIPNGMPGVETRPALMFTFGVREGRISKEQMVATLSENISRLFGMYPKKGCLKVGSDADIVIWSTEHESIITAENQEQNVDYSPYEGMKIKGRAEHVFLRGNHVVKYGSISVDKKGEYVIRGKSDFSV